MYSKRIILKTTSNTRTLSNLVNREGKHIKRHLLIRSDALWRLDEASAEILKNEYGLSRVIDLRCENECLHKPDILPSGVQYIHNPILPNERLGMTKKGDQKRDIKDFIVAQKESGIVNSMQFMEEIYRDFIRTDFSNLAYRNFLNLLLEPVLGGTLWHCSAGKDRVGFATFLVLYLLDFDMEIIIEDYLATNLFYEDVVRKNMERLGKEYEEILWCVFGVHKEYIDIILEEICKSYQNMENYITNALQFDEEKRNRFKELYLEG